MIDARRMEVYTALFDQDLNQIQVTSAEIISAESFQSVLNQHQIIFFGDGAAKCKTVLGDYTNAVFIDDFLNEAEDLTLLAEKKFNQKHFEDVAYFEPFYLKDFIGSKIG
ncbi:MAG: hypothetical protein EOP42_28515 [Sphingobacteriaceae bacterium]|nr:MAG: hypothetical protein EOP42_28515 [Sphingobacteriaceae bacterium]